ncbi:malonyl-acyl carrier protein O-methyltransferase BioC [compost metagenome]
MVNKELEELAAQLRQPSGAKGIEVAVMMNETNIRMTHHSIDQLGMLDRDNILELGHGNGGHLSYLFEQNAGVTYYGLEISALMHEEAKQVNQSFINRKQAAFYMYDGLHIPFAGDHFDKVFTVNTLYFWTEPELLLAELYRVIKPGGILNITFAQKDFMEQLPFTSFGFTLYDHEKIKQLIGSSPFRYISSATQTEKIKSKTGDLVDREFLTVTLGK